MARLIYGFEGLPEAQQPYEARFGRWLACDREQGAGYAIPTIADPLYYWESVPPIAHKKREAEERARALCSMGEDVVLEYLSGRPYVGRRYVKGWMLFLRRKNCRGGVQ
jgi:hypothetical protein